jgi:hypothetical protein
VVVPAWAEPEEVAEVSVEVAARVVEVVAEVVVEVVVEVAGGNHESHKNYQIVALQS